MTLSALIHNVDQHEWRVKVGARKVTDVKGRIPRGNTITLTNVRPSQKWSKRPKADDQVASYVALQKYEKEDVAAPSTDIVPEVPSSTAQPNVASRLDSATRAVTAQGLESEPSSIERAVMGEIGVVRHELNKEIWVSRCVHVCDRC